MKNYIKQIHEQMFGDSFCRFLQEAYDRDEARGQIGACEQAYLDAHKYFYEHWNQEENETLSHIEKIQGEKCRYAGEYAFFCGMNVAFDQLFTGRKELRFDFSERLHRGLYEIDGMKRHPYYFQRVTRVREAYDALEKDRGEQELKHMTSHECGWDQRIHSGAIAAYYLGYRVALAVIDKVHPHATQSMMDQILVMEYQLGMGDNSGTGQISYL